MSKLMILDGNSIVNRAFYGVSQNLTTRSGQPTNAIFGFLNILNKLLDEEKPDIRALMLKPCKLHKTMKLPAALAHLREQKVHLAIVIDEFGGTLGVVTMEDILEELVGDIWDDTDVIVTECVATGENTYEVTGDMNIEDCFEEIGFHAPEDFTCEYITMGGWVDASPRYPSISSLAVPSAAKTICIFTSNDCITSA